MSKRKPLSRDVCYLGKNITLLGNNEYSKANKPMCIKQPFFVGCFHVFHTSAQNCLK